MNREELEEQARKDHAEHVGKVLTVKNIQGYIGDESGDFCCNPPAKVRVLPCAHPEDLEHWVDEWLDPYWDVELVEPHPQLEGARSFWIYGISYNAKTGEKSPVA